MEGKKEGRRCTRGGCGDGRLSYAFLLAPPVVAGLHEAVAEQELVEHPVLLRRRRPRLGRRGSRPCRHSSRSGPGGARGCAGGTARGPAGGIVSRGDQGGIGVAVRRLSAKRTRLCCLSQARAVGSCDGLSHTCTSTVPPLKFCYRTVSVISCHAQLHCRVLHAPACLRS